MNTAALSPRSRRLVADYANLALWTLQGWLSMFFIAAGYAKLTEPMANLTLLLGWPAAVSESLVRGVGGIEIGLAIGLLAPLASWRLGRPVLLMASATLSAMALIMLVVHATRLEPGLALINLVLFAFAAVVLWGRAREAH
jgi:hypothetical protein